MIPELSTAFFLLALGSPAAYFIHHRPAFWTVVCLGLIQITLTYYGSRLAIESLPAHVPHSRRRRHRLAFTGLFAGFICLTFLLAKLNDSNQYQSEVVLDQERTKQERLQAQLQQTLNAVLYSQGQLQGIRQAVDAHPAGAERSGMLSAIDQIQRNLQRQTESMKAMQ